MYELIADLLTMPMNFSLGRGASFAVEDDASHEHGTEADHRRCGVIRGTRHLGPETYAKPLPGVSRRKPQHLRLRRILGSFYMADPGRRCATAPWRMDFGVARASTAKPSVRLDTCDDVDSARPSADSVTCRTYREGAF